MMRVWVLILFVILPWDELYSQAVRKLPVTINRRNKNHMVPTLTGDGRQMIYLSDLAEKGHFKMWYTRKLSSGNWKMPEVLPITIDNPGTNLKGGYCLSFDGRTMVFTSKRRGSIGGFDIWISEKEGENWGPPRNAGKPLNSELHEGDPSLSPDGKFLYFTRCNSLSNDQADKCQIMVAEMKSNGYFKKPILLPANINTGNEVAPRILADNLSLVFSSSRPGGKGGFDYYITRFSGESWSDPEALGFLNSTEDDRYISIPINGDIAYFSKENDGFQTLYMVRIPAEFQPKKVLWIEGIIQEKETNEMLETVVRIYDNQSGKLINSFISSNDKPFSFYLSEGKKYDFSVMTKESNHTFYSRIFELDSLKSSRKLNLEIKLNVVEAGIAMKLNGLKFNEFTSGISPSSEIEMRRLIALMKKNHDLKFEIGVHLKSFKSDTINIDPDLTELVSDTIIDYRVIAIIDSVLLEVNATIIDSLENEEEIDSLRNVILTYKPVINQDTLTILKIINTYHNDRTQKQAEAVMNYLLDKGAPPGSLIAVGYGNSKNRDLSTSDSLGNYVVEIKFFQ